MAPGASVAPAGGVQTQVIESQDLVTSLPAPILRLLIIFARPISYLRSTLEVVCWKPGRRMMSWMVVGVWWGLCLGAGHAFRYLFPPLIFLPLIPLSKLRLRFGKASKPQATQSHPSTADTLLLTLADLHAINAFLPPSPIPTVSVIYSRFRQLGAVRLCRGLVVLWISWIILGRVIGYRSLLALLGTTILLSPSPPLAHLVDLCSKSLFLRRGAALAFLFTFGSPPDESYRFTLKLSPLKWARGKWAASRRPSLAFSLRPQVDSSKSKHLDGSALEDENEQGSSKSEPIYFRFEMHENQRWWMGLDWTSALLPSERSSWCDSHLLPVSPPPSYPLPSSASIVLPSPTKSDPKAQVRRTANWRWLDDDWAVIRSSPSTGPSASPNPNVNASTFASTTTASAAGESEESTSGFSLHGHAKSPSTSAPAATSHSPTSSMEEAIAAGIRAQSIAEQAFTKGLERFKVRTSSPAVTNTTPGKGSVNSPARTSGEMKRGRTGSQASEDLKEVEGGSGSVPMVPGETLPEKDDATDADGWVYGDNKWENMGPRGGLGRFTRRRRWHRRAILLETVERIQPEPDPEPSPSPSPTPTPKQSAPPTIVPPSPATPLKAPASISRSNTHAFPVVEEKYDDRSKEGLFIPPASPTMNRDDVLRLRLKKAMGSVGG